MIHRKNAFAARVSVDFQLKTASFTGENGILCKQQGKMSFTDAGPGSIIKTA